MSDCNYCFCALQFIARTAKDMTQWVLAISQAGIEDSSPPHSRRSQHSPARRELPSLPDSEVYDDVGIADSQQNYELVRSEDEIYHDISEMYQNGSVIHSQREPSLPPRTPIPSVVVENTSEELYDDVGLNSSFGEYYNLPRNNKLDNVKDKSDKNNLEDDEQYGEVIYDDIGVIEQSPEDPRMSGGPLENSGRIQNIIRQMEASISNGNKHTLSRVKPEPLKSTQSEELYEPINASPVADASAVPQLPPRSNLVR